MQITWWLFQFRGSARAQGCSAYPEVAELVRSIVPASFEAGLMVKTHHGGHWQASSDKHPLAIAGPDQLRDLAAACSASGVALGAWGECQDSEVQAGELAGISQGITGYYAVDLEPYSDFGLEVDDMRAVAGQAERFWRAYDKAGGGDNCGVTVAPQPSGITPFGASLWHWLRRPAFVHLQEYYTDAPQLAPGPAESYVRNVLATFQLERAVIPIFEPGTWEQNADPERYPNGVDVWSL